MARFGFEFDGAGGGYVDLELLVEHNTGLIEIVLHPELSGREGRVGYGFDFAVQRIAGAKARDRHMLFVVVGINGRIGLESRCEILHCLCACRNHRTVRFDHSNIADVETVIDGVVAEA